MNLKQYTGTARGTAKELADKLGISTSFLSQIAAGTSPVSAERCVAIEKATNGAVMRWDLRPDDWHLIWPELRRRKDAPAVSKAVA